MSSQSDEVNLITSEDEDEEEDDDDATEGADAVEDSPDEFDEDKCDEARRHENDEEGLDPRIQVELEKLNSSTDVINKLEVDLEEARASFQLLLKESGQQLDKLAKRIGHTCVDKARPYYESRMTARRALAEAQRAAVRYEKASSAHEAAKEMVALAEKGYEERNEQSFDHAWQEMLNHASARVNESEAERDASAAEHRAKSMAYSRAEARIQSLQKSLKRTINKSRPYYELKARYNQLLDDQKRQVQLIEETITMTKCGYSDSLKELERISEEIHERRAVRRQRCNSIGVRQAGVGAEFPLPPPPSSSSHVIKASSLHNGEKVKESGDQSTTTEDQKEMQNVDLDSTDGTTSDVFKRDMCLNLASCPTSTPKASKNSSSSSNASTSASQISTPLPSPSYEQLLDTGSNGKVTYLSVQRRSDDEISESDSMASMEPLDDDQIEQLMLDPLTMDNEDSEDCHIEMVASAAAKLPESKNSS